MKKILTFVVCCILGMIKVNALENDSRVEFVYIDNIYSNRQIGEQFYTGKQGIVYVNGKIAYCLDPTLLLQSDTYSSSGDFSLTNITEEQLNYLEVVNYFGYKYRNRIDSKYYLATQEIIWEYLTNGEVYWTAGKDGDIVNVDNFKQEILDDVNHYFMLPDLPSYSETYKGMDIVLEDKNEVLEYYDSDLWLGEVDGNKLTLSATNNGTVTVHLVKRPLNYESSYIYMSNNSQTLATFGYSGKSDTSVAVTYKVKALTKIRFVKKESGSNQIIKNRETKIKIYDMTRNQYVIENGTDIFTIGASGILETATFFEEGEYRIEEICAPIGYKKLSEPQIFNIYEYHGPMTYIDIYNDPYSYTLSIYKKGEVYNGFNQMDGKISGMYILENMNNVVYGLFAKEDIIGVSGDIVYPKDTLVTNITIQNGFGATNNLLYGKYYLKEIECPKEYVLDTTITDIEFSQDESLSYNFFNYLKKGTLSIYKVDGQKGLQGAHFLLRGTNYSFDTYLESNSFGFNIVEDIPYDLYSLQEIKSPIGYIMDNEIKTFLLNQAFLQYNFENKKEETEKEPIIETPAPQPIPEPSLEPTPGIELIPEADVETIVENPKTAFSIEYTTIFMHILLYISLLFGILKKKSKL